MHRLPREKATAAAVSSLVRPRKRLQQVTLSKRLLDSCQRQVGRRQDVSPCSDNEFYKVTPNDGPEGKSKVVADWRRQVPRDIERRDSLINGGSVRDND